MPLINTCPVTVDWGDGTVEGPLLLDASLLFDSGFGIVNDITALLWAHPEFLTHTYALDGTYTVRVQIGPPSAWNNISQVVDRTFTVTVGSPSLVLRAGAHSADYSF